MTIQYQLLCSYHTEFFMHDLTKCIDLYFLIQKFGICNLHQFHIQKIIHMCKKNVLNFISNKAKFTSVFSFDRMVQITLKLWYLDSQFLRIKSNFHSVIFFCLWMSGILCKIWYPKHVQILYTALMVCWIKQCGKMFVVDHGLGYASLLSLVSTFTEQRVVCSLTHGFFSKWRNAPPPPHFPPFSIFIRPKYSSTHCFTMELQFSSMV